MQKANRPLQLFMGKDQSSSDHRKSPPHLAPKIHIPQTRKETIHKKRQERDPKPFSRQQNKGRLPEGPSGVQGGGR